MPAKENFQPEKTQEQTELEKSPEIIHSPEIDVREKSLVFIVGLPGSGKSTFAREHFPTESIISTDALRGELSNNMANQLVSKQAFEIASLIVRSRLAKGQSVVIDAMNLSQGSRQGFAKIAKSNFFSSPTCVVFSRKSTQLQLFIPPSEKPPLNSNNNCPFSSADSSSCTLTIPSHDPEINFLPKGKHVIELI